MTNTVPSLATEAERQNAADAAAAENAALAEESAAAGQAYRDKFESRARSPRHEESIQTLNKNLNEAVNDLMRFAQPGETYLDVAERGIGDIRDQHLNQAATRAIAASKSLEAEIAGEDTVLQRRAEEREQNRIENMESMREHDIMQLAKGIAARQKISVDAAIPIAMMQAETDNPERVLPRFSRSVRHNLADRENDPFVHAGGAA